MRSQWQLFLNILPPSLRCIVDEKGRDDLQELRLRIGSPPELVKHCRSIWLDSICTKEDITFCINAATKYSPWTSQSITEGFITAPGGHRIGICGDCINSGGDIKNINHISSICVRIARQYIGIASPFYNRKNSILIIGRPGSGKTTFLRDLLRGISESNEGALVSIDERHEIFPMLDGQSLFETGRRTDVLSGIRKANAIDMALRTMSPKTIAMDEITHKDDCKALMGGARCGVRIIATAHAGNRDELYGRPVYKPLLDNHVFQTLIVLNSNQSWQEENFL